MGHHRAVAGGLRRIDGVEGLAQRADLVDLHEDRVGHAGADSPLKQVDAGDEEVVAHQRQAVAQRLGEHPPAVPVVLRHAVLDGADGIVVGEVHQVVDHLRPIQAPPLARQPVDAGGGELGGRHVEGQAHVGARSQPGGLHGVEQQPQCGLVARHVRREAALVADGGGQPGRR